MEQDLSKYEDKVITPKEFKEEKFPFVDIQNTPVHIFGDIHGMQTNVEKYFEEFPYKEDELYIFLGDYIDRGDRVEDSLRFMINMAKKPNVVVLKGNHEQWLEKYVNNQRVKYSYFKKNTAPIVDKIAEDISIEEVKNFTNNLRKAFVFKQNGWSYLCVHGGLVKPVNLHELNLISEDDLVRGTKDPNSEQGLYETNVQKEYSDNMEKAIKENHLSKDEVMMMFFGHRSVENPEYAKNRYAFCAEGKVEKGGNLIVYYLDKGGCMYERKIKSEINTKLLLKEDGMVHEMDQFGNEVCVYNFFQNKGIAAKELGTLQSGAKYYALNFRRWLFKHGNEWEEDTQDKRSGEERKIARGMFISVDESGDVHVIARSYNKFFNSNEITPMDEKLKDFDENEPVIAYRKENGFLGMVSVINDELHFFSKSTDQGKYAELVKETFYKSCKHPDKVLEYLNKNNQTMVMEVIDPQNDPHIIKYEEPKIVMLDLFENNLKNKRVPYEELTELSKEFGCECKHIYKAWNDKDEFKKYMNYLQRVGTMDKTDIEGIVVECKNHEGEDVQFKCKFDYYLYWKENRTNLRRIKNDKPLKSENDFTKWIQGDPGLIEEIKKEEEPNVIKWRERYEAFLKDRRMR